MYLILFLISLIFNIGLSYLLYRTLRRALYFSDNIDEIIFSLQSFQGHLSDVYQMETFYGDDTLQNMLDHSRELGSYLLDMEAVLNESSTNGEEDDDKEEDDQKARP
jgi:hypothetical protein